MNPIIVIVVILVCFWSIFTTCKAIYLILNTNFNGSKITWILISMIGIIGPILWITQGKKRLKNDTAKMK